MTDENPKRPGRPRDPHGPTAIAELFKVDRRSPIITVTLGLNKIRAAGNDELADEIQATIKTGAFGASGDGRGWASVVEFVARFQPGDQRWAWEQARSRGVRWLKRYVETQNNPPDSDVIAERFAAWIDREYPAVDTEIILEALAGLTDALERAVAKRA